MTSKLAWKNIWRNKTRSLVFIIAAILGFAMALFTLNTMKSISQQRLSDAINIQTSYIQIHKAGFMEDREINFTIPDAENVMAKVKAMPGIEIVSKRISCNAVVASPENNIACEIKGVMPQEENEISVLKDFLVEGEALNNNQNSPILVSKRTAERLKLKVRSKVVVTIKASNGEITGGSFRVAGIFVTPSTPYDESTVIARYNDLQELSRIDEPHELVIKVTDPNKVIEVQMAIQNQLTNQYQVNDWKYLLPELFAFDGFINMVGMLFTIIIIIGLGFSLMNTMNMIVQERTKELGMLRAIGQGKWSVFRMLLKESGLMTFIGAAGGIVLGIGFISVASKHGISISEGLGFLGIRPIIYPTLHPGLLIMIIVLAIVLTVIISTFPASRALAIKPQEALRD